MLLEDFTLHCDSSSDSTYSDSLHLVTVSFASKREKWKIFRVRSLPVDIGAFSELFAVSFFSYMHSCGKIDMFQLLHKCDLCPIFTSPSQLPEESRSFLCTNFMPLGLSLSETYLPNFVTQAIPRHQRKWNCHCDLDLWLSESTFML